MRGKRRSKILPAFPQGFIIKVWNSFSAKLPEKRAKFQRLASGGIFFYGKTNIENRRIVST